MIFGIVLANGIGSRFGTHLPKQFQTINGKKVLDYSIDSLLQSKYVDNIVVVIDDKYRDMVPESKSIACIPGGNTRNSSLKKALNYIHDYYSCDKLIIVEAARPMIRSDIIDHYIMELDRYDAVITGQHITDSLGSYGRHYVNRDDYYLIQAPEAFRFDLLYDNFNENSPITATNQQLPVDSKISINFDFKENYKLTYPEDLQMIESQMRARNV